MPSIPWEDYRDKKPVRELIESTRARASRLFGGTAARSWLTAIGMELLKMGWLAGQSLLQLTLIGFTEGQQGEDAEDAEAVEVGQGWWWRRRTTCW